MRLHWGLAKLSFCSASLGAEYFTDSFELFVHLVLFLLKLVELFVGISVGDVWEMCGGSNYLSENNYFCECLE